jgi:hypothetical protein
VIIIVKIVIVHTKNNYTKPHQEGLQ